MEDNDFTIKDDGGNSLEKQNINKDIFDSDTKNNIDKDNKNFSIYGWYKTPSVVISLIALLFSLGTTIVTYYHNREIDIQNNKIELRRITERLMHLYQMQEEIMDKYHSNPLAASRMGGYINQENSFLSAQAHSIINYLPFNRVSAIELYSFANCLYNAYQPEEALKLLARAKMVANDVNTESSILRYKGMIYFYLGNPEEGRTYLEDALNVFDKYPEHTDETKASTHITTLLKWAEFEAFMFNQEKVIDLFTQARIYLSSISNIYTKNALETNIEHTYSMVMDVLSNSDNNASSLEDEMLLENTPNGSTGI